LTDVSLVQAVSGLTPWPSDRDLSGDEWADYVDAARRLRDAEPREVTRALGAALAADEGTGDNERRLFVLLRVLFDLPRSAPAAQRLVYKGWVNWPAPDDRDEVDLGWPVAWEDDRPRLVAAFEGSMGPRYAAVEEYDSFRERFGFRALPEPSALRSG
jgi:hypothetical protein